MAGRMEANRPLRYGQVGGPEVPVVEMELSASVVFKNVSGRLVTLDSSQQLAMGGATTTELIGGVAWGGEYTSSATAGTIVGVNTSDAALWLLPIAVSSVAASRTETQLKALIGKTCDLIVVSSIQYAAVDASARDVIQIVDYRLWGTGTGDQAVVVRLVPSKVGATGVV